METWVERASQWVTLIGTPVLLTLVATMLPWQVSTSNGVARLEERVTAHTSRLDAIDKRLGEIDAKVDALNERMTQTEADPTKLLARAGIAVKDTFSVVWVNGTLYVLPKTGDAAMELQAAGYERTQITPFLKGWRLPAPK